MNRADFFCRLGADMQQGARVGTLFACYEDFPALCGFYIAGQGAALAVAGGTALVAGPVYPGEEDELSKFLAFLGVARCEAWDYAPPFLTPQDHTAMVYRGGATPPLPPGLRLERTPSLSHVEGLLTDCGLLMPGNAFFADVRTRRNRGILRVYALSDGGGALVSTAGIYSAREGTGYLACVATLPAYRGRGCAGALAAALGAEGGQEHLWLCCLPAHMNVYTRAGFAADGHLCVSEKG